MDQAVIATAPRKTRIFLSRTRILQSLAARIRSTPKGTGAVGVGAAYVPRSTSDLSTGGAATDGNILRRTITMDAPQQMHRSSGRGVGAVEAPGDGLHTNNLSSEIMRLQLGCKKPKLRERRNPLLIRPNKI